MTTASANHRPNTYCSDSGDICQSTAKVEGVRKLQITLAAKYFDHYKLCVVAPDDSRTCHGYDIQKRGDFFGDVVRWDTNFPDEGPGAYTVIWKTGGDRVGHKLGFHR
jgi:hypothetical protein